MLAWVMVVTTVSRVLEKEEHAYIAIKHTRQRNEVFCPSSYNSFVFLKGLGRVKSIVFSEYRHAEAEDEEEEVEEELSTHLNTSDIGPYLEASEDHLRLRYIGRGGFPSNVGTTRGNRAVPVRRLLYYFEMTVEDSGRDGRVSIGFTDERFPRNRQPGWDPDTFGYHGDDGRLFHNSPLGVPFGPTFTAGDTVGAGINNASQDVFFTKNGEFIGSITKDFQGALFPTVGLHSPNERVIVNFGQNNFIFDIQQLAQDLFQ